MNPRLMALVIVLALMVVGASGCGSKIEQVNQQTLANRVACGEEGCHPDAVEAQSMAAHKAVTCDTCHRGTGEEHANDPKKAIAATDWTIDSCAGCHEPEATTYLYDDNARPGPFGGSTIHPPQPKADTFPLYSTILAGHAFTKEYNEEGAHAVLLEEHYKTTRGKFETCVQCKSTKVALAWNSGKPLTVTKDTDIVLTHTAVKAAPGVAAKPASTVTIPAGTQITYKTDEKSEVDAEAVFPDGTKWSSKPAASEDATKNYNMVWASTIAATKDTWPYGAGCNHCHDPHTAAPRLVRKAEIGSIESDGGVKKNGGVNPYREGSPKSFETASAKDKEVLMCGQCHVEYTCGKSGVDKIDRDFFGWSKATDLHALYQDRFGYAQDWKHAIMGEPLIKSQHPETELYWESPHYDAGASCADCHMPEVRDRENRTFRSHWFTSPYKYGDAKLWKQFAESTGVDVTVTDNPCERCHEDRTARGIEQQREFFAAQAEVEKLLAVSVTEFGKLKAAKDAGKKVDKASYDKALDAHRQAHVIWENLAVSENSMGFHNFGEAMSSMAEAKRQAIVAIRAERAAM